MARTQGQSEGGIHTVSKRCPSNGVPAMTRKSRLFVIIAAASLPMIAACGETTTAPEMSKARKMSVEDSLGYAAMGCGEVVPWGKAPCPSTGI